MRRLRSETGMTLLTVLFAVIVIGLMLGLAGRTWSQIMQREREDDLLFRGDQYRRAIKSYYEKIPGGLGSYPTDLQQLVDDTRFGKPIRHLRRLWPDPLTGEDWELILIPPNFIKGVRSRSPLKPFRQDGFVDEYAKFNNASAYNRWEFVFEPKKNPPASPGATPPGEPPPATN